MCLTVFKGKILYQIMFLAKFLAQKSLERKIPWWKKSLGQKIPKAGKNLPRKVEKMYSDIWFPERLDSEKWPSSLLSMRLNWKRKTQWVKMVKLDNAKAHCWKIATFSSNFHISHSRKNEQTLRHKKTPKSKKFKTSIFC